MYLFRLTVHKEGPNKGRQFYGCPKGMNSTCNFFQWADETDNQHTDWSNSIVNRGKNKTHNRGGSVPKKPRLTGKRKCGNCGMEGKVLIRFIHTFLK